MNKTYVLAPLVALLAFGTVYWNFQRGDQERVRARQAELAAAQETQRQAELETRRQAMDEALRTQAARKQEREAKEAADLARKAARQTALDARDHAFREREKFARQLERLKKDLASAQADLARIDQEHAAELAEQTFLRDYVQKAEANVKALADILARLAQAEAAREAAAKKNS